MHSVQQTMQRQFLQTGLYLAAFSAALFFASHHPDYDTRLYGFGVAIFLGLLVLLRTTRVPYLWITHAMLATAWALVVWAMAYTGGVYSTKLIWFSMLLPVSYLFLQVRQAAVWSVVFVLTVVAMAALQLWGVVAAPLSHNGETAWWSWLNRVQVLIMMLVCVHLYRYQHQRAMREKAQYHQALEETSQTLQQVQAHKDAFLAAVGHELRTPMNAILGLNGVLRMQLASNEEDVKVVDLIRHSTEQLLQVVNHILDFSRLQAQRLRLMPEAASLEALLQASVQLIETDAQAKGLSLRLTAPEAAGAWVQVDPARLQQIIQNLLHNAVRFSEHGVIELRAHRTPLGWRFEVQDQGVGISPEQQTHIFHRFEHADTHTHRLYGGTGLGLTICDQLVRLMGGHIGVQSQLGAGACFWFDLPLQDVAPVVTISPIDESVMRERAWRVLVVDDNELNRVVVLMLLKKLLPHAQIQPCGSAQQALAHLQAQVFDVVLMDIVMPEMDGMRATQTLRAQAGPNAHTPVLAMTAIHQPEDRQACLAAGMNGMVAKPLRAAELTQALASVWAPSIPPSGAAP